MRRLCEIDDETKLMLVTVYGDFEEIAKKIADTGYKGKIVNVYDLLPEVN